MLGLYQKSNQKAKSEKLKAHKGFTPTPVFAMHEVRRRAPSQKQVWGFTLVELIVSLGVFTTVLLVSTSALLNIFSIYRVTEASREAMDNLNFALEDIAKSMRTGINFHCGDSGDRSAPQDCWAGGGTFVSFTSSDNNLIAFRHIASGGPGRIERSDSCTAAGCSNWQPMTAPQLTVDVFNVYVTGALPGGTQPRAFLTVQGAAGIKTQEQVHFNLQTTVTQRIFDQ